MTRIFPTYRNLLRTHYGWLQYFRPSRVLQENVTQNVVNGSASSIKIVCQPVKEFHHPRSIYYGADNPFADTFSLLLFDLALVIVITRIIRMLLKPFKQPKVISQIIGGIIVGPSVMGRSGWFRNNVAPDTSQFMVKNLGVMGFMFFLFVYGVKMDPALLKKSGKVHISTALIGISIPTVSVFLVSLYMRKNMEKELATIPSIGVISGYLGTTAFPVLYNILKELNLLNSDVGRMSLSIALIGDAFGASSILVFEAGKQGETASINALWFVISVVMMLLFLLFCLRPAMEWIIKKTPEGCPIDQSFVVAILLGIFLMGFLTDMLGMAIANGPMWLGLVIPDGPPLGATLVEKSKTIMNEFLLPFSFMLVGSYTDVYAMSAVDWSHLSPLFFMVLVGYLTKFFSTWLAAFYWRLPFRDGLTLSLIMSLRGQIELILFVHFLDKRMIKLPGFTLLVLMTVALTATFSPLISILYDPTKPYMVSQRRNIQHNPPDSHLSIVLCILDAEERLNGLIKLIDFSNPTSNSPLSVSALRSFELVGRANPLLIDHYNQEVPQIYQWTHTINVLKQYQQVKRGLVKLNFFTVVSPKQTVFQDICVLALEQDTSLIILPYKKGGTINSQVLNHAPCSVAILVDKGIAEAKIVENYSFRHKFVVLFLGGADAREALVYADRMVSNHDVSVTLIRFLSENYIGDNEREKKLDDGIVTWFWVKNEMNRRVVYREVVVRNGEQTIGAIHDMNDGSYDLWIVGRKQGINPVLLTGLTEWSESEELGVIGEYISSDDFSSLASVLVVQQQLQR